ncbi:MAG: protein translocase subunit SecD [Dehalococcoidia bacterium]
MRGRLFSLVGMALLLSLALGALLNENIDLPGIGVREGMKLGLDLRGGTDLMLEADLSDLRPGQDREEVMAGVEDILRLRVDKYGLAEPVIQRELRGNRIRVQLPGVKEADKAAKEIGAVWLLNYRKLSLESLQDGSLVWREGDQEVRQPLGRVGKTLYIALTEEGKITWLPATGTLDGEEITLTGDFLEGKPQLGLEQFTSEPEVYFEWNEQGGKLFEQITTELVNKPLGIFLDDNLISAPTVLGPIGERGRITGLTLDEAEDLIAKLDLGRLPVPLKVTDPRLVSASLGAASLARSLQAAMVGLALLLAFMLFYYRFLGVVGNVALLYYGVLVLALFKLIPVTLTLSGMAGFIISLGMAVDANVLVFERLKEELRAGRTFGAAVEVGFSRAWQAIRDSNVTTLVVCVILFVWGRQFGANPTITGFALTLGIGVVTSMFTAIVVTRGLLRVARFTPVVRRRRWFAVSVKE